MKRKIALIALLLAASVSTANAKSLRLTALESTGDCGAAFYVGKVFEGPEVFHYTADDEMHGTVGINGSTVSVRRVTFTGTRKLQFRYQSSTTKVMFTGSAKQMEDGVAYNGTLKVSTSDGTTSAKGTFYSGC
jgi:carbonic anhydrase